MLNPECFQAKELHLLLVARRAEPPALARERQQILVLAVVAAHAGETLGEIPAAHELLDHLRENRAQEAVLAPVDLGVDVQLFEPKLAVYISERQWHPSQVLKQRRDGRLELRMKTTGRKELVRWVLSWMPDVRVLAPKSLRDRIAQKLEEGLRRNARTRTSRTKSTPARRAVPRRV
jgi:hypothetical protein